MCIKKLVRRNSEERPDLPPDTPMLAVPFVLVRTKKDAVVHLEMTDDRKQVFFNFRRGPRGASRALVLWLKPPARSDKFTIEGDHDVFTRMGLTTVTPDELKREVPAELLPFFPKSRIVDPSLVPAAPASAGGAAGSAAGSTRGFTMQALAAASLINSPDISVGRTEVRVGQLPGTPGLVQDLLASPQRYAS
jgi:hypothetical protein